MKPRELDPVMVRRLKSDLRYFGAKFPERKVEAFVIKGLPQDAPELLLSRMLLELRRGAARPDRRTSGAREAGYLRLSFVGLQQRLLSSIAAFAKTLEVHRKGLVKAKPSAAPAVAEAFVAGRRASRRTSRTTPTQARRSSPPRRMRRPRRPALWRRASRTSPWSTRCWRSPADTPNNPTPASGSSRRWIRRHMTSGSRWNERRLVLFTEYEDTRRWLEIQLAEALDDLAPDDRIASFTGATSTDRREELEAAVQFRSGEGSAADPDLHRRGARRHQLADALLRPHPCRPALEPGAARTAQRPHRPQTAALAAGLVSLFRL